MKILARIKIALNENAIGIEWLAARESLLLGFN